jgi:hypothetical protein
MPDGDGNSFREVAGNRCQRQSEIDRSRAGDADRAAVRRETPWGGASLGLADWSAEVRILKGRMCEHSLSC